MRNRAALTQALSEMHTGRYLEPTKPARQFLCDEWLPASAARGPGEALRAYRELIDAYAVPSLGDLPLPDVTPVAC
jgi:hypothetical protein